VKPNETVDDHVLTILSVLLPALTKLVEHEFKDHLPGGEHMSVNLEETKSADKHNKFPERVFAYVDHLLTHKPNITSLALESHVTFSLNKTDQWLATKDESEVQKLILSSRQEVKNEKKKFKIRECGIREKRLENLRLQFEKKAKQEENRIKKLEKETTEIQYYGLWQSEEQVDSELGMIGNEKEKEEALKAQIRFRKNVFSQKADSVLFSFSKMIDGKRSNLSVEDLTVNVKKLVKSAFDTPPPTNSSNNCLLVGKRIKQKFVDDDGKEFWSPGKVISQVLKCFDKSQHLYIMCSLNLCMLSYNNPKLYFYFQVPGFPRWYNKGLL